MCFYAVRFSWHSLSSLLPLDVARYQLLPGTRQPPAAEAHADGSGLRLWLECEAGFVLWNVPWETLKVRSRRSSFSLSSSPVMPRTSQIRSPTFFQTLLDLHLGGSPALHSSGAAAMREIWNDPSCSEDQCGCVSVVELIMEISQFLQLKCKWMWGVQDSTRIQCVSHNDLQEPLEPGMGDLYRRPRFIASRRMRTTPPLTAEPAQYITVPTIANNHRLDVWGSWHSISLAVTTRWKDEGSYMTGGDYRSWAHWASPGS